MQSLRVKVRVKCVPSCSPYVLTECIQLCVCTFFREWVLCLSYSKYAQILQKSGSRVKILGARRLTWSKLHVLGTTCIGCHLAKFGRPDDLTPCFVHPYRTLRLAVKWTEFSRYAGLLFQMKPTRCPLILGIFISASVHVSGNYVSIIRRTWCIYVTLVFFTLYGWLTGLLVGMKHSLIPTSREVD